MALSIAQYAQVADWFARSNTTSHSKTVTSVAWTSGDIIVALGGVEFAGGGVNQCTMTTPTNANLTFSLGASNDGGGAFESSVYVWSATAGSSQTGQTITTVRTSPSSTNAAHGIGVWVITGAPTGTTNATANLTESSISRTVSAGSVVVYGLIDFNATNPPGKTPLTGSGTATERRDAGDGTTYAQYLVEWVGTAAGTFSFGPNNYTSLQVAQAIIEVTAPAAAAGPAGRPHRPPALLYR